MDAILLTVALDKLRINAQLFLSPGHLAMIMEGAYTRAKRGRKGRRAAHNIMCDVYVSVLLMAKQVWENSWQDFVPMRTYHVWQMLHVCSNIHIGRPKRFGQELFGHRGGGGLDSNQRQDT